MTYPLLLSVIPICKMGIKIVSVGRVILFFLESYILSDDIYPA